MPTYIAKHSVGQFMPGDEIKGLNAERIQALLASGAIEEYKPPVQVESESKKLKDATAKVKVQEAEIKKLQEQVANLTQQNEELKAVSANQSKDQGATAKDAENNKKEGG